MNISDPEWLMEVKPLTAPCASSQVPGRVPAGPWVVPAPLEAGGQCWKTECGGEVAQPPGALDSGLSRTQREPREPPLRLLRLTTASRRAWREQLCCLWPQSRGGGLGDRGCQASASLAHPRLHISSLQTYQDHFFLSVCAVPPTGRPPMWGTRLCLLSPVPKNDATET